MSTARRTQEHRSAETQRALLQATIDCLVDYGYAGTTTRLVADRAAVSRGAQTHHFPTKRDLVVAAIEHLFDEHARGFAAAFEQVPTEERTLDRAVEALWTIASGPAYAAILEVVVAARTDDELRAVVHGLAASLEQTGVELLMWFSPEITDPDVARRIIDLAFTVVQGAAISRLGGYGEPDDVIAVVRRLAGGVTTALAAPNTARPTPRTPSRPRHRPQESPSP